MNCITNMKEKKMRNLSEEIINRYLTGQCSEEELIEVNAWISESDENGRQLFRMEEIYHLGKFDHYADEQRMANAEKRLYKQLSQEKKKKDKVLHMHRWMRYAAILAVALLMGGGAGYWFYNRPEHQMLVAVANEGSVKEVVLPDGTKVWLNNAAMLKYPREFSEKERNVYLDGEAYIEVAHNKEIPFYVQTENIKVQVTGTKFDVCSYKGSNSFIARLIEGSINLLTNSAKEEKTITSLTKGKYFSMENGKNRTGEMSSNNALAWMQGIYYFDDVPFKELLDKIALYYNYKITVKNPKILENYRCTGKFKDLDGIEHILKVIQKDHPFKYDIDNEHNKITIE